MVEVEEMMEINYLQWIASIRYTESDMLCPECGVLLTRHTETAHVLYTCPDCPTLLVKWEDAFFNNLNPWEEQR